MAIKTRLHKRIARGVLALAPLMALNCGPSTATQSDQTALVLGVKKEAPPPPPAPGAAAADVHDASLVLRTRRAILFLCRDVDQYGAEQVRFHPDAAVYSKRCVQARHAHRRALRGARYQKRQACDG